MRITGTPEEFAALALALQERRDGGNPEESERVRLLKQLWAKETVLKNGERVIPFDDLTDEEKVAGIREGLFLSPYQDG